MFTAQLTVDSERAFQRTLQRLADSTDRPVESVLRQQGRLLANDLAFHVNPRGLSAAKGKSFSETIRRTIWSFYMTVGEIHEHVKTRRNPNVAKRLVRLIRSGKLREANDLLKRLNFHRHHVAPFDGGALHRSQRWRRSRSHPILVVPNDRPLRAYVREMATRAGLAKAALVNAGRQLDGKTGGTGGGRPAAWITRHRSAPGRGSLIRNRSGFSGTVTSLIRYARSALPFDMELRALRVRQEAAEKQLKRILDYKLRRAMRGA